jgi:adenosylmethionine-8-amino-7-oxononanoate aminotransferase
VWDGENRQASRLGMGRRATMSHVFRCMVLILVLGVTPDIQTIGKGLNGGYQALSAVLISEKVVAGLKSGSGAFANGQTFQCHPAAAAAGVAVMDVFDTDDIVGTCAKRGALVSSLDHSLCSPPLT